MKSYKVLLSRSPAFPSVSLCKEKIIMTNANDRQGHPEGINPNTSENSTFPLAPNLLQVICNLDKQVLTPVKFEVYFDDSKQRITDLTQNPKTIVLN